jgi:hypothetical protein
MLEQIGNRLVVFGLGLEAAVENPPRPRPLAWPAARALAKLGQFAPIDTPAATQLRLGVRAVATAVVAEQQHHLQTEYILP